MAAEIKFINHVIKQNIKQKKFNIGDLGKNNAGESTAVKLNFDSPKINQECTAAAGGGYNMLLMQPGEYKKELVRAFSAAAAEVSPQIGEVHIQPPRNRRHGDYACAIAMQLAPALSRPPPDIAAEILQHFAPPSFVAETQIVGGYINIRLHTAAKTAVVSAVLRCEDFGRGVAKNEMILLEFVSANPTGPLHIGHGRAAAFGDSLANLLSFAGSQVWREYYVNDAGRQTDILAASLWLRHFMSQNPAAKSDITMPEGSYRGDYLPAMLPAVHDLLTAAAPPDLPALQTELAGKDADAAADLLVAAMHNSFAAAASNHVAQFIHAVSEAALALIKTDLAALSVAPFDCWFSERALHAADKLTAGIDALRRQQPDNIYEEDGALWFRAVANGDDKDRVLRRANGRYTYFAADVAYHYDKLSRPADKPRRLINILGADHHGYVPRLSAAVAGLGYDRKQMETVLIQFAALIRRGQRIKMSTRAGDFITLSSLVQEIGCDAARFFYVSRKNDQHLDFDLALASEKSSKNPVYYLQYAHARAAGICRKWGGDVSSLAAADCASLADNPAALALCELLAAFPDAVQQAAQEREVHLFVVFLQELAVALHHYYEKTRILTDPPDAEMPARLAVLAAAQSVLKTGLTLLGIAAPERM